MAREVTVDRATDEGWTIGLVQATLAVLFGIAVIFWPDLQMSTLVYLFSAFLLAWGLTDLIRGISSMGRNATWWAPTLFGLASVGVGVYLVRNTDVAFDTLILLVGFTLIVRGVLDAITGLMSDANDAGRMMEIIVGVAAVVAGIVILQQEEANGTDFVWILGLYALILGALGLARSMTMRDEARVVARR